MNSVFSFVVGLLTAALSLLGFVQQHPELPQASRDQAQQIAQQAITQATQALTNAPGQSNSSATVQWKIYTNSQYRFSFKYPATWLVTNTKDGIKLTSSSAGANDITFLVSPIPSGKTLNTNCQPSGGEDVNSIVDGFHSTECKNLGNTSGVQYARGINAGMSTEQTYREQILKGYFLDSQESIIIQTLLTDAAGNTSPSTVSVFDGILQSVAILSTSPTAGGCTSNCGSPSDWKVYSNTQYGFQFKYPSNLDIQTLNVSGPDGSVDHQFYIQGFAGVDSNNPPRLVGVLYPARFANNQEQLLSFNQNPTSGFTAVEKDFFNLGKAIFHGGSSICGGDYQMIFHGGYEFTFFSDAKCSYDPQITEIMNTFKFTK